ncbi:MAG: FKBP-type peptidyl-prolyl cis-trans isomerase [Prevotellaceae bacterium]|jgi:FKBP-type peptidyl-prolyl cis-trans isomerase|nr:FKBP-type peptidyl-prolyl cis-trans isomerase [Prevotellaceae bacterium]
MKKLFIVVLLFCSVFASAKKPKQPVVAQPVVVEQPKPAALTEIVSYALGANMAEGLSKNAAQFGITIDWEWVKNGITDAAAQKNQFDEDKMREAFQKLDSLVAENQKLKSAEQKIWLENNKSVEGVITTESGLQYKIVTLGTGEKPAATDNVTVHYEGKLIDGTVFDSSIARGEPITFPLNQVIKGWTEGVQLMPVGSKFIFYIPSELGYGEQGAGGTIPPGATLIFEVELLETSPAE